MKLSQAINKVSRIRNQNLSQSIFIQPYRLGNYIKNDEKQQRFPKDNHHQEFNRIICENIFNYGKCAKITSYLNEQKTDSISQLGSQISYEEGEEPMTQFNQKYFIQRTQGFSYHNYQANKQIQDTMCTFKIQDYKAFVVSVFDGHGGPQLSRYCASHIRKYFLNFLKTQQLNKNQKSCENTRIQLFKLCLLKTYEKLQKQFYDRNVQTCAKGLSKTIKNVGTCALTIIIIDNKIIVANAGDSQAIVIEDNRMGSYKYRKLNEKLSTANKNQRERLLKQFKGDDNILIKDRKTYYVKGILQPTKSLGDYYLKKKQHFYGQGQFKGPYISHVPQISVSQIQENDKYIVIASDGLWDYLQKWDVLKQIIQYQSKKQQQDTNASENGDKQEKQLTLQQVLVQKILDKVSEQANLDVQYIKKLSHGDRRRHHDDITIGLIDLKKTKAETN